MKMSLDAKQIGRQKNGRRRVTCSETCEFSKALTITAGKWMDAKLE
jgi:hypothetical protein